MSLRTKYLPKIWRKCFEPYLSERQKAAACRLVPGTYLLTLVVDREQEVIDHVDQAASFEVIAADIYGTGKMPLPKTGVYTPEVLWEINPGD